MRTSDLHRRTRNFRGGDGLELVADKVGPADGPPVIFLHGWGQTRHAWGATLEQLGGRGWRAISVDLRGHGDSAWSPDADYAYEAFKRDILVIVSQLGAPAILVGASLGGMSTLLAAAECDPGSSARIVLVDVTPRVRPDGVQRIFDFMAAGAEGFETLEEAAEAVAGYLPQRARRPEPMGLRTNVRLGRDGRYRWHWDPRFLELERFAPSSADSLHSHMAEAREQMLAAAEAVPVPILLVHGRLSDIVDDAAVEELLSTVDDGVYINVGGAGHMVAGDSNDDFTQALVEFLEGRPPRASTP